MQPALDTMPCAIAAGIAMQVGRASSGSFDAAPARMAASSSSMSLLAAATKSTTSGSTGVSPSGANTMFFGVSGRTGMPGHFLHLQIAQADHGFEERRAVRWRDPRAAEYCACTIRSGSCNDRKARWRTFALPPPAAKSCIPRVRSPRTSLPPWGTSARKATATGRCFRSRTSWNRFSSAL